MDKYYKILGLQPGADKEAIKKAYRRLAMKYHPDVNPGKEAKEKFMEILEAYEYLTGARQARRQPDLKNEDLEKLREILVKLAKERAKAKYRERVKQLKQEREKEQARQYTLGIYTLIGIIVLYFSVSGAWKWYYNMQIDSSPAYATTMVTGIGQNKMIYSFWIGDSLIEKHARVSRDETDMLAGNGLPLKIGDEFELVYKKDNPYYHRINFEKTSAATMNRYLLLVSKKFQEIYSGEWKNLSSAEMKRRADCLTLFTFQKYGFDGLSTVFYHDSFFLENFKHNSIRWFFMSRSDEFESLQTSCRGEVE